MPGSALTEVAKQHVYFGRSLIELQWTIQKLVRERLWLQVLIGMALGVAAGIGLSEQAELVTAEWSERIGDWLALPGNLFLAVIKFVVVPLVAASVVRGIASGNDAATVQKIGGRVLLFFLATTIIAVFFGVAVAELIGPGGFVDKDLVNAALAEATPLPVERPTEPPPIPQRIVALLPTNPYETMVSGDMLQVVIAAAIMGIAMLILPPAQSKPFLDLAGSIQAACMVIVTWVMRFAPVAVFGLIAQITAQIGFDAIVGVSVYMLAVVAGLAALLAFYLALVGLLSRQGIALFFANIREVFLLGFSTSSSAAVMPLSLKTAEEKLGVRPAVSRFVVPLGATVNMAGTALYQAVATIFLAQVFGVDIGGPEIVVILVTAIGASIGAPGTPGVGIVILASILTSIGVPQAGVVLILGVDRILDMARTAVNVTGDLVTCVVMDRWIGDEIAPPPELAEPPSGGSITEVSEEGHP